MTTKDLAIATSTVWVILAAILVMFMQAGFAFLEAGLTRMKNVGHIAAKNVLILALASIVYFVVGFGIAFGDGGNGLVGGSGFMPSIDELTTVGEAPFSWFGAIPAAAGYLFEVVFCAVSLAIVWGAMAERTKLWVYFVFGAFFTLVDSLVLAPDSSPERMVVHARNAGLRGVDSVDDQGALAGLAGALMLGPRIGKFGADGRANAIPGHNMAFTTLGVIIRLARLSSASTRGSTPAIDFGGAAFFAYVALNTNLAAAAGVLGAVLTSWIVIKKPDLSMMLNGAVAALAAITAACAFVGAVGSDSHWARGRCDGRAGRPRRRAHRHRRPDRRDLGTWNGGSMGNACARLPHLALAGRESRDRKRRPLLRWRAPPAGYPGSRPPDCRRVHVHRLLRVPLAHEGDCRHPHGCGCGDRRSRCLRARNVGLPRVLHSGPRRLRHGSAWASRAHIRRA